MWIVRCGQYDVDSTMWIVRCGQYDVDNIFNAISEEFDLIVYILLPNNSLPIDRKKAVSDTCNVNILVLL